LYRLKLLSVVVFVVDKGDIITGLFEYFAVFFLYQNEKNRKEFLAASFLFILFILLSLYSLAVSNHVILKRGMPAGKSLSLPKSLPRHPP